MKNNGIKTYLDLIQQPEELRLQNHEHSTIEMKKFLFNCMDKIKIIKRIQESIL
jgi:hypothetical protein